MGFTTRRLLRRGLREAVPHDREAADALAARAWERFDHGTQRAILKLYRSAPPDELARAGERLGAITSPALVVWGDDDPFLLTRFAHEYARALGGGRARTEIAECAGHWPWLDRPELVDRITSFITGAHEH
jgi:pimeloyl-ACP methyl ester carboxylesterase